jgi:hypothetical protein
MTPWQNYDSISLYNTFKYFFSGLPNPILLSTITAVANFYLLQFVHSKNSGAFLQWHLGF